MDNNTEKRIIKEYKEGKSSLQIAEIVGYSKPTILKVLHKHNLVRKRDRCEKLKYEVKNGYYVLYRKCPTCNKLITTKSKDKLICCRNHINKINNKNDCKTCSLEKQKGKGNPFYGKKHTKKSKKKISNSRKGKAKGKDNSMSNPIHKQKATNNRLLSIKEKPNNHYSRSKAEKKIYKEIKRNYPNTQHSYIIDKYICDIYIPELNLIIEYNGDYWHCNPSKYESHYFHKLKDMTAYDIWKYDKTKVDYISKNNYIIESIWESDYVNDPSIIKKILLKYAQNKNTCNPQ